VNSNDTKSQVIDKGAGFVSKLFRGDVSLPITYWVFGVLIDNVGCQIALSIIESNYLKITSTQVGAWSVMGFYWLAVGYSIFMLIAIWRSASKYQGRALWSGFARVAVVFGTIALAGKFMIAMQQGSNTDLALIEEIKMINKSLPSMIDSDTRLDHVSIQGKDVYYNYTLVNWLVADMDVSRFTSVMTPKIKTAQCANEETRPLLNEGRKLVYLYRDKASKPIAEIVVERSDCFLQENKPAEKITNGQEYKEKPAYYEPSELFKKNNEAVVLVRTYDDSGALVGFGSGFNVHENGVIVTNLHVVLSGGSYLDVKFPKHGTYEDVYIAGFSDASTDLAILKMDGKNLPTVNISPSVPVSTGDKIYTISNPEGLINTLSEGLVSAERITDNTTFFQITAPISEGSSGGAVFNKFGEVVGVASMVMKKGQNLNFAVSIDELSKIEEFENYFSLQTLMDYLDKEKSDNP
jgi:hypothetical protein